MLTVLYLCSVQPELSELSDLQTYFESLAVSSELPSCLHHLSFASQSFFLPLFFIALLYLISLNVCDTTTVGYLAPLFIIR